MTEPKEEGEKESHAARAGLIRGLATPGLSKVRALFPKSFRNRVRKALAGDHENTIDIGDGAKLAFSLDDSYWSRFKSSTIRTYEPEMWFIADRYFKPDTVFVDCGANIGLWSSVAGAKIKNKDQVIAVEPGSVAKRLRQNHELNEASFTILNNAVWDKSGVEMSFADSDAHASNSLLTTGVKSHLADAPKLNVKTISVDDIVSEVEKKAPKAANVVVKLDVEGVEREAVAGMAQTLKRKNTLIAYEDHGNDPASETTADLLKQGLNVYYIDPASFAVTPVASAEQLKPLKINPTKGYNFIATMPGSAFDSEFKALAANGPDIPPGYKHKAQTGTQENTRIR